MGIGKTEFKKTKNHDDYSSEAGTVKPRVPLLLCIRGRNGRVIF